MHVFHIKVLLLSHCVVVKINVSGIVTVLSNFDNLITFLEILQQQMHRQNNWQINIKNCGILEIILSPD